MEGSGTGIGWTRFPRLIKGGMIRACLSEEIPTSFISNNQLDMSATNVIAYLNEQNFDCKTSSPLRHMSGEGSL